MISYTDGKYAHYWNNLVKKSNNEFKKELEKQLKLIFPTKDIPKPLWIKHHFWGQGACYWKPKFNSKVYTNEITKPSKKDNIYFINSNYSTKQAWIEGGLIMSNNILNQLK